MIIGKLKPIIIVSITIIGAVILIRIMDEFNNNYKDKIIQGRHKIILGEFDEIGRNIHSEWFVYRYNVNGAEYRRTISNIEWHNRCKNNIEECKNYKFLVIYLIEDPQKSLINLMHPIKETEVLPDFMNLRDLPILGFKYLDEKTILRQFR